ncbi:MAG: NCS2 family permease [Pseudomonadota bacterium]
MEAINRRFQLDSAGTSVRTEVIAGLSTFLTMVYISVVNPAILSDAGMDFGAVFVATCLAAAYGTLVMGLLANYPIALAPGMGQNAFFAYTVVLTQGHSWQTALGAVFVSGVLFVVLSLLPVREWLINSIPRSLKQSMTAGIGLFLGFIALSNAGVVTDNEATLVGLGELLAPGPALALFGFILITALAARGVAGAVVIGILAVAAIGWLTGVAEFRGLVSLPPSPAPVLLQVDISSALEVGMLTTVLTMLLVDVFDTAGTLVGVATRAGLVDEEGNLPRLRGALFADSSSTAVGALVGTSSTTSYIESAAGVEAGGRTGLTAVVCGLLFLVCLFFSPLAQSIPAYATASALLFVASLMASSLADLDWDDLTEVAPAMVGALAMPLTFSIAEGIGLGFICYAAIKLLSGRGAQCPAAVYLVAAVFALKYVFL